MKGIGLPEGTFEHDDDIAYITLKSKIKKETGLDLKGYKDVYIKRRLVSRLSICGCANYTDYVKYLNKYPEEYKKLKDFITINVTRFFRDKRTYDYAFSTILPQIITEKENQAVKRINIWSAGCSIGEEPYSISMMLYELLGSRLKQFSPTIFATDVDDEAMKEAMVGEYGKEAFSETDSRFMEKYLIPLQGGERYSVKPEIKSIVTFKHQDMIHDKPLASIDLIFCRNVLIYFDITTHDIVLGNFYEALKPGGYLVIGGSESIHGEMAKKFQTLDIYAHAYRKPENAGMF